MKNSDIFLIAAQNIDCGYSLEPPRRGGSNEYPQSMFLSRNKKNNAYPCKPQFCYTKAGFKGGQNYIGMFSWWFSSLLHISPLPGASKLLISKMTSHSLFFLNCHINKCISLDNSSVSTWQYKMAAFYIVVAILYCDVDTEELSNEVHLFMWQLKETKKSSWSHFCFSSVFSSCAVSFPSF